MKKYEKKIDGEGEGGSNSNTAKLLSRKSICR
jgi:hypothetical protein